jgi:hypothetical protein
LNYCDGGGLYLTGLIDSEDFAIVKIAGHPAKRPSFWINRADFVRQYQKVEGFWLPYRDETSVEAKMYGRRAFTVDHQRYVISPVDPLRAGTGEDLDKHFARTVHELCTNRKFHSIGVSLSEKQIPQIVENIRNEKKEGND